MIMSGQTDRQTHTHTHTHIHTHTGTTAASEPLNTERSKKKLTDYHTVTYVTSVSYCYLARL